MDEELHEWIGKAKNGDTDAFALLLRRYQGTVYRHAYGMLADRMEAEDVAQEAFIKAFNGLPKLEETFAFTSWLTRIVANLCYDRLQKRNRSDRVLPDAAVQSLAADGEMDRVQLHLSIEEAMNRLSPEHRQAVILRDVEGYTYEEIAEILDLALGTVKSRIHTARMLLRKEMNRGNGGLP